MSPYFREDNRNNFFDVNIYIDNKIYKTLHIADNKGYQFIKIENLIPNGNTMKVSFEIKSNVSYNKASWQRASLVNFKFMSLRPMKK